MKFKNNACLFREYNLEVFNLLSTLCSIFIILTYYESLLETMFESCNNVRCCIFL